MNQSRFRPRTLITARALNRRVRALAREIDRRYRGRSPVLIGIMQGAFIFMADLVRALRVPCTCAFLHVSSYGKGTTSPGRVRIRSGLPRLSPEAPTGAKGEATSRGPHDPIRGRHVLVVEDIVDTGHTLREVLAWLRRRGPASVRVCALLHKPSRTRFRIPLHHVGFRIPDVFVVGYGLDHAGRHRELPFIGVVEDRVGGKQ